MNLSLSICFLVLNFFISKEKLTIALLSVYDTPKDKIVWDVGHQCYVYKILTGRREQLKTLRQLNGLSDFLNLKNQIMMHLIQENRNETLNIL